MKLENIKFNFGKEYSLKFKRRHYLFINSITNPLISLLFLSKLNYESYQITHL